MHSTCYSLCNHTIRLQNYYWNWNWSIFYTFLFYLLFIEGFLAFGVESIKNDEKSVFKYHIKWKSKAGENEESQNTLSIHIINNFFPSFSNKAEQADIRSRKYIKNTCTNEIPYDIYTDCQWLWFYLLHLFLTLSFSF